MYMQNSDWINFKVWRLQQSIQKFSFFHFRKNQANFGPFAMHSSVNLNSERPSFIPVTFVKKVSIPSFWFISAGPSLSFATLYWASCTTSRKVSCWRFGPFSSRSGVVHFKSFGAISGRTENQATNQEEAHFLKTQLSHTDESWWVTMTDSK